METSLVEICEAQLEKIFNIALSRPASISDLLVLFYIALLKESRD